MLRHCEPTQSHQYGSFYLSLCLSLCVRVSDSVNAQEGAAPLPGVATLVYSASHPVTRLEIQDEALGSLNATLYAYTPFQMWNASSSGVPAVAFTLVADNRKGTQPVALDFMLSSPTFSERGIARTCTPTGSCASECQPSSETRTHTAQSAKDCKALCAKDGRCASWSLNRTVCTISSAIERTVAQQDGMWSGTAGQWLHSTAPSGAPVLTARRPSIANAAGPNYDAGDLSFTADMVGVASASAGTSDDLAGLWDRFATTGRVGESSRVSTTFASATQYRPPCLFCIAPFVLENRCILSARDCALRTSWGLREIQPGRSKLWEANCRLQSGSSGTTRICQLTTSRIHHRRWRRMSRTSLL